MSQLKIALLSIGQELLYGKTLDTNSNWIAREIDSLGAELREVRVLPDNLQEIKGALQDVSKGCDVVITTGGLGPTSDDLTRYAVAEFVGTELEEREEPLNKLIKNAEDKGRSLQAVGRKQALFPASSNLLPNSCGTAEGFVTPSLVEGREVLIFSLPGVPREMKEMFTSSLVSILQNKFSFLSPKLERSFKLFGVSESIISQKIEDAGISDEVEISFRPQSFCVLLTLRTELGQEQLLEESSKKATTALGEDVIFTREAGKSLQQVVGELLAAKKIKVSFAESCTGGLMSQYLVENPGSSEYFCGSTVSYSNQAKVSQLAVSQASLQEFGAVSSEVAIEMARGALDEFKSDIAVSVTGIAGPSGGTPEKPIGTVWFGFASKCPGKEENISLGFYFSYERNSFRKLCALVGLDIIRRYLLGISQNLNYMGKRLI